MSRFDSIVAAEAWERMLTDLRVMRDSTVDGLTDYEIGAVVREVVLEVEGEDL